MCAARVWSLNGTMTWASNRRNSDHSSGVMKSSETPQFNIHTHTLTRVHAHVFVRQYISRNWRRWCTHTHITDLGQQRARAFFAGIVMRRRAVRVLYYSRSVYCASDATSMRPYQARPCGRAVFAYDKFRVSACGGHELIYYDWWGNSKRPNGMVLVWFTFELKQMNS